MDSKDFWNDISTIIDGNFSSEGLYKRVYGTGDSISCSTMKQANRVCCHPMMVETQLSMLMKY